jgi:hypothetical protein
VPQCMVTTEQCYACTCISIPDVSGVKTQLLRSVNAAAAAANADTKCVRCTTRCLTISMRGTIAAPLPSWKERVDTCSAPQHRFKASQPTSAHIRPLS